MIIPLQLQLLLLLLPVTRQGFLVRLWLGRAPCIARYPPCPCIVWPVRSDSSPLKFVLPALLPRTCCAVPSCESPFSSAVGMLGVCCKFVCPCKLRGVQVCSFAALSLCRPKFPSGCPRRVVRRRLVLLNYNYNYNYYYYYYYYYHYYY